MNSAPSSSGALVKWDVWFLRLQRFESALRGSLPGHLPRAQSACAMRSPATPAPSDPGSGAFDYGSVYELSRNGGGGWNETTLYSFCSAPNCAHGARPSGLVILDCLGNLYGTGSYGGNHERGGSPQFAKVFPDAFFRRKSAILACKLSELPLS
jgi:hypothetical protein